MIEGLQPYFGYRYSTAPWFGDVPSHWDVKRLGSLFGERGETNERREVTDILSVLKDRGVIPYAEKGRIGNKASDDIGRYKIVRPDDLVVNCMNVIIGSLGRSRYTGCLSPVYYVLRRRDPKNDPRYLELLFQHRPFHQSLIRIGNGILAHRMRIPMEKLKAEMLPLPPPDEQAAIVRFLDHANRKIDGFIRAKRKLIALLGEQKQAIIHSVVTRGLNPNAPLKPSGIPWLGDIPKHWDVKRLLSVAKFISTKAHEQFVDPAGTHICVTARFVSTGGTARKFCTRNLSPALKGDVLMVMSDLPNGRALARAFLVEDEASYAVNQRVCIIRPSKMNPAFLAHQANRNWGLLQNDDHSNQTHLSNCDFKTLPLLCPPLSEQEEILRAVEVYTKHIPGLIAQTDREIALMQEYRTRLTTDVVTGKLDVRLAVRHLPAEPLAPEPEREETEA